MRNASKGHGHETSLPVFSKMRVCRRCLFNGCAKQSPTGSLRLSISDRSEIHSASSDTVKLQRVLNAAIESFKFCTTKSKSLVTDHHGHSDEAMVQRLGEAITLSNWSGGAGERTKPKPVDINLHKQGTHANLSPKMANSRLSLSRSAIPPPRPS